MQAVLFLCKFCRLFIALCLPVCIKNDQYFWSHTVPLFICKRVFTRNAWCFTSAEGSVRDLLPNCDQKSSIKCSFVKLRAAHHCQQENLVLEIFMRCNVLQRKQTPFFFFFFCTPSCSVQLANLTERFPPKRSSFSTLCYHVVRTECTTFTATVVWHHHLALTLTTFLNISTMTLTEIKTC